MYDDGDDATVHVTGPMCDNYDDDTVRLARPMRDNDDTVYPAQLARLDAHYTAFWKLCISHILCLPPYPHFDGVFQFNGHPVTKVDILGVVVYRNEREKCFIYGIDDGTGVIKVCQLKPLPSNHNDLDDQSNTLMCRLLSGLDASRSASGGEFGVLENSFELGDLVHVRGQLKSYMEKNEVFGVYLARVSDPNTEILYMRQRMELYDKFYLQPVRIPLNVRREFEGRHKEDNIVTDMVRVIKTVLLETEANKRQVDVYVHDLMTVKELENITSSAGVSANMSLYQKAMLSLEKEGVLYRDNIAEGYHLDQGTRWRVIQNDTRLHSDVLSVLSQDKSAKDYREEKEFKGTYYLAVLKLLTRNTSYKFLGPIAVQKCLEFLEEQGKVFGGMYRGYYMTFNG